MSEYPTQDFIKAQIKAGKWPAQADEVLDIRSLSDREVKIIELYNQEEIIKQLRRIATALEGNVLECVEEEKPDDAGGLVNKFRDLFDDGQLNNSIKEE